jgi:hypothetical protein
MGRCNIARSPSFSIWLLPAPKLLGRCSLCDIKIRTVFATDNSSTPRSCLNSTYLATSTSTVSVPRRSPCPISPCITPSVQAPLPRMAQDAKMSQISGGHQSPPVLLATIKVAALRSVNRRPNTRVRRCNTKHRCSKRATSHNSRRYRRSPCTRTSRM